MLNGTHYYGRFSAISSRRSRKATPCPRSRVPSGPHYHLLQRNSRSGLWIIRTFWTFRCILYDIDCIMSDHSFYPSIFRLSSLSSLAAAFKTHASGTHVSSNLNCVVRHLLKVCFFFCERKINFSVAKCPTLPNIHFCPFMNDDRSPRCMPSQGGVSLGFVRMV